jgi:hypothetical protein
MKFIHPRLSGFPLQRGTEYRRLEGLLLRIYNSSFTIYNETHSTPSSKAVHPSRGELAQSSSVTYGATSPKGGQFRVMYYCLPLEGVPEGGGRTKYHLSMDFIKSVKID